MRWVLCGLTFALAVLLAAGTAAIRADNHRMREQLWDECQRIDFRSVDLDRLRMLAVEQVTPERLAVALRALVDDPATIARRQAALQAALQEGGSWQ